MEVTNNNIQSIIDINPNDEYINISSNVTPDSSISNINMSLSEETLNEETLTLLPSIQKENKKKKRLYWADCARIFSMFAIVFLHSAGYGCEKTLLKRNDKNWIIVCCYNCLTRFGVPMFVLLSGTFILDPSRKLTFKKLFRHNILHLATAFVFWSTINSLLNIYLYKNNKPSDFLKLFFVGEEYLWFIFMIIGCYLISPFLRLFSDNVVLTRYFLALCVFWGSIIPTLKNVFTVFELNGALSELDVWTERWHFHFTLEFVGYYVAGYHIVKHVNIKSFMARLAIYFIGIADFILFTYLTYMVEQKNSKRYSKDFRDNYTITVAIYTIALFIFFKHEIGRIEFSVRAIKIITKVSSLTFGMYLSHMIIKVMLSRYAHIKQEEFLGFKIPSSIGCPIFSLIISILSLLTSYLISKVPILKKYII